MEETGAISLQPKDTGDRDFQDSADLFAGLDVIVTVDTAAAHLAGSLGKPTLVLLPKHADWRWMRARPDSPWYPSARLLRQSEAGDWASTLAEAQAAVMAAISSSVQPMAASTASRPSSSK